MSEQRKGRLTLILLVLVFALPVAAVVVLHSVGWRPAGKSYGELMQPPQALNFPPLDTTRHQPFAAQEWRAKWHLVYISGNACDEGCRKQLHTMRQLHASLAKEIDRLQRVWLIAGKMPAEQIDQLQQQYPDLIILQDAAVMAAQFNLPNIPAENGNRFYLVDPLGNFIMSYPQDADPYGMRKDLMRMLTYSWAG